MSGAASKYACLSCTHVAYNRRMLAHHVALCHATRVYKCPLCPFISSYQANLYRHKRLIHRQPRSTKPNDAAAPRRRPSSSTSTGSRRTPPRPLIPPRANDEDGGHGAAVPAEATLTLNNECFVSLNGFYADDAFQQLPEAPTTTTDDATLLVPDPDAPTMPRAAAAVAPTPAGHLTPVRFKRTYTCIGCDLSTTNPREFLAHQRDVHMERINIYECNLCMYASKSIQKLQRHYGLIHKEAPKTTFVPQPAPTPKSSEKDVSRPDSAREEEDDGDDDDDDDEDEEEEEDVAVKSRKTATGATQILKCSKCMFTTRSKFLLSQHEKNDHLKRKFFRCVQCGYITNERGRYTKHVKYHSMPKQKCDLCDFETPYKWNMDRHIRYHYIDGEYKCSKCSFTAEGPKSLAFHLANHHRDGHQQAAPSGSSDAAVEEDDVDVLDDVREDEDAICNDSDGEYPVEDDDEEEEEDGDDEGDEQMGFGDASAMDEKQQQKKSSSSSTRRPTLPSEKKLKCKYCTYCTAWHSDLRRHESGHKTNKKHQCPLCGIGFDSLPLVSRHLGRMHRQDSEARNIASMIQLLTNKKKAISLRAARARSSGQMPVLQRADSKAASSSRHGAGAASSSDREPSYLHPPLIDAIAPTDSPQAREQPSLKRKGSFSDPDTKTGKRSKTQHQPHSQHHGPMTCNVCGYRTKWISELEKHMRVHSEDKPFSCPYCEYSSKWKGDLTRHVQKYHEKAVRSGGGGKTSHNKAAGTDGGESRTSLEDDGPLDLSVATKAACKFAKFDRNSSSTGFQSLGTSASGIQTIDVVDSIGSSNTLRALLTRSSSSSSSAVVAEKRSPQKAQEDVVVGSGRADVLVKSVKKYKCPFCSFMTRTASRFHVHIIQHYNKKPFMCSVCGKKSNWQWDISKHIKINAPRDDAHKSACVLLTDECGRKNYDKYDEYLVRVQEKITDGKAAAAQSQAASDELAAAGDEYVGKQEFAVSGSQAPENIVVTPDISFVSGEDSGQEGGSGHRESLLQESMAAAASSVPASNGRQFRCSHCEYRHHEKKVVVGHLSIHAGISPYRCRICGFSSNWRQVMMRHIKGRHNGRLKDLQECFTYVQENDSIRLLGLIDDDDDGGGKKEATGQSPQKPVTSDVYECTVCPYKCDKPYFLRMHMQMHQPRDGANYKCKYCPYYVKYSKNLYRHTRMHKEANAKAARNGDADGEVDGEEDDEVLSAPPGPPSNQMYSPYKTPKRYGCELCPYQSDNKTYLLYHKQFHRPNKSAPFKCQHCSYWAYYLHLLKQHERVHQGRHHQEPTQICLTLNNDYDIGDVPETTSAAAPLAAGDREAVDADRDDAHQEDGKDVPKLFKCRYCPMTNKRLTNVRAHEKMHWKLGSWMHSCHLCSYRCGNRGVLTAHVRRVHREYTLPPPPPTPETVAEAARQSDPEPRAEVLGTKRARFTYYCENCPAAFKSHSDYSTHSSFHGANLPFSCPYCDYKARHKPHLHKHLIVHTQEYIAKRAKTYAGTCPANTAAAPPVVESAPSKTASQMLLLEETETRAYATGHIGRGPRKTYRCPSCPAAFTKSTILVFHKLLHETDAEHRCTGCTYATNNRQNFETHRKLHVPATPTESVARGGGARQFPCAKCPASFSKMSRYNRHASLHGQNNRFKCDECDYSVVNSANLVRHKKVHLLPMPNRSVVATAEERTEDQREDATTFKVPDNAPTAPTTPLSPDKKERSSHRASPAPVEKTMFGCGRCPYAHSRRDAVMSHMSRHCTTKGMKCPHCDYYTLHPSYITEHMKKHFQPLDFFKVDAYVRYESLEIWRSEDDGEPRRLFCKDTGPATRNFAERFDPPVEDRDLLETLRSANLFGHIAAAAEKQQNRGRREATDGEGQHTGTGDVGGVQPRKLEVVLTDVLAEIKTEKEEVEPHHYEVHVKSVHSYPSSGSSPVFVKAEAISDDECPSRPPVVLSETTTTREPVPMPGLEPVPQTTTSKATFLDNEETMPYEPSENVVHRRGEKPVRSQGAPEDLASTKCTEEADTKNPRLEDEDEDDEDDDGRRPQDEEGGAESDEYPEMIPMKESIEDEMLDDEAMPMDDEDDDDPDDVDATNAEDSDKVVSDDDRAPSEDGGTRECTETREEDCVCLDDDRFADIPKPHADLPSRFRSREDGNPGDECESTGGWRSTDVAAGRYPSSEGRRKNLTNDSPRCVDEEEMKAAIENISEWNASTSGGGSIEMDVIVEDLYPQVGDSVVEIVTDAAEQQPIRCSKLMGLDDVPSEFGDLQRNGVVEMEAEEAVEG